MSQTPAELRGQRIVGIVVKALIPPQAIDVLGHGLRASAPPSQRAHPFIRNPERRQTPTKHILIELRIRSRSRKFSDIRNQANIRTPQQLDKLFKASIGMAYGEPRQPHALPLPRTSVRAPPL